MNEALKSTIPPTFDNNHVFKSGQGNITRLGKLVQRNESSIDRKPDLLYHNSGPRSIIADTRENFNSSTKFPKEFFRRSGTDIFNEEAARRREYGELVAKKSEALAVNRSVRLQQIDRRNGYDVITGEKTSNVPYRRAEGIKYMGDGLGPEAPLRGHHMLRDSRNRFFTPQYNGPAHEYRQAVLKSEGLIKSKFSRVLYHGKPELVSYGIEDQFSKSNYMQLSASAQHGLVETTAVGKYTPRKQQGNPSGNPDLTKAWGKGVLIH